MQTTQSIEPARINLGARVFFTLWFWMTTLMVSAIVLGNFVYALTIGLFALLFYQLAFETVCDFDPLPIKSVALLRLKCTYTISLFLTVLTYVFNPEQAFVLLVLALLIIYLETSKARGDIKDAQFNAPFREGLYGCRSY